VTDDGSLPRFFALERAPVVTKRETCISQAWRDDEVMRRSLKEKLQ
jgi:hypothetical protein